MKNLKESFLIFLRGLFMGTADAIPGVSGGTIALITGIYERLIYAINNINNLILKELFHLNIKKAFKNLKKLDFKLFIPLALGIIMALFTFAHIISYLLTNKTAITYSFFFGLILSSSILVYKHTHNNHLKNIPSLLIGILLAIILTGLTKTATNHSNIIIFLSGAIAICAMILPGISGAFILVLLNQYEFIINLIKTLQIDKIIIFAVGALVGILSFSKILTYLLKSHKKQTMALLTGLMIGSLRIPFYKIITTYTNIWPTIISTIIGFTIVFILEKKFTS